MCGLTAVLSLTPVHGDLEAVCSRGLVPLQARGPDASGIWRSADGRVAMGHQRLAIVGLGPAGRQPMVDARGGALTYNGEVYNHRRLRGQMSEPGGGYHGDSDTETILHACAERGPADAVRSMVGMFAFAWWDVERRELVLVRDRIGIKPLFFARSGGRFLVASTVDALLAMGLGDTGFDRCALDWYARFGYLPRDRSVFAAVRPVLPGWVIRLGVDGSVRSERWWSLDPEERGCLTSSSPGDVVERTGRLVEQAVGDRLMSEVPLGAFLSGGVDSSLVAATMSRLAGKRVRTFAIGFDDPRFDESGHAAAIAGHLGTDHTCFMADESTVRDLVPSMADTYDEPFADSSQLPTALLCRLTRREVTVALSGDGGDECFVGYDRYRQATALDRAQRIVPGPLRHMLAHIGGMSACLGLRADRPAKLAEMLKERCFEGQFSHLVGAWPRSQALLESVRSRTCPDLGRAEWPVVDRLRWFDLHDYLPCDILTKVDRASMAHSLEVRVPLLDHRLVEWGWSLSSRSAMGGAGPKWILRSLLERHVPRALFERPKSGFAVPLARWLRGPLREWAEELLTPRALEASAVWHPEVVRRCWRQHVEGRRNWHFRLWTVLMFQSWFQRRFGR